MTNKAEKLLYGVLWTMIAGFIIHGAMALYFYDFYQQDSVVVSPKVFPVITKTIVAGDPLIFTSASCVKGTYQADVDRIFKDKLQFSLVQSHPILTPGCNTTNRIIPDVTDKVPPDTYVLVSKLHVTVKWFYFTRVDSYENETEPFTIIPRGQIDPEAASTEK